MKLKVDKETIDVSNPDKILFPKADISKQEFVAYYEKIADTMLPHIKQRPLTMHRFPNGVTGEMFYQKDAPDHFPDFIPLQPIKKSSGGIVNYPLINTKAALVYLANYVCVPHIWLSREPKLNYPDRMIFDLDPSDDASFALVKWAAKELKELLESIGLPVFLMTTGSRGLHVVVPIKQNYLFDDIRNFAKDLAQYLVKKYPEKLTLEMKKEKRGDRIFMDTLRNAWSATSVAPYGVRAKEGAPIATPIQWSELSRINSAQKYTIKTIFKRLSHIEDPWKDINSKASAIDTARRKFEKLKKEQA